MRIAIWIDERIGYLGGHRSCCNGNLKLISGVCSNHNMIRMEDNYHHNGERDPKAARTDIMPYIDESCHRTSTTSMLRWFHLRTTHAYSFVSAIDSVGVVQVGIFRPCHLACCEESGMHQHISTWPNIDVQAASPCHLLSQPGFHETWNDHE